MDPSGLFLFVAFVDKDLGWRRDDGQDLFGHPKGDEQVGRKGY